MLTLHVIFPLKEEEKNALFQAYNEATKHLCETGYFS